MLIAVFCIIAIKVYTVREVLEQIWKLNPKYMVCNFAFLLRFVNISMNVLNTFLVNELDLIVLKRSFQIALSVGRLSL